MAREATCWTRSAQTLGCPGLDGAALLDAHATTSAARPSNCIGLHAELAVPPSTVVPSLEIVEDRIREFDAGVVPPLAIKKLDLHPSDSRHVSPVDEA